MGGLLSKKSGSFSVNEPSGAQARTSKNESEHMKSKSESATCSSNAEYSNDTEKVTEAQVTQAEQHESVEHASSDGKPEVQTTPVYTEDVTVCPPASGSDDAIKDTCCKGDAEHKEESSTVNETSDPVIAVCPPASDPVIAVCPPATDHVTTECPPASDHEISVCPPASDHEISVCPPASDNEIAVCPPASDHETPVCPPASDDNVELGSHDDSEQTKGVEIQENTENFPEQPDEEDGTCKSPPEETRDIEVCSGDDKLEPQEEIQHNLMHSNEHAEDFIQPAVVNTDD